MCSVTVASHKITPFNKNYHFSVKRFRHWKFSGRVSKAHVTVMSAIWLILEKIYKAFSRNTQMSHPMFPSPGREKGIENPHCSRFPGTTNWHSVCEDGNQINTLLLNSQDVELHSQCLNKVISFFNTVYSSNLIFLANNQPFFFFFFQYSVNYVSFNSVLEWTVQVHCVGQLGDEVLLKGFTISWQWSINVT